MALQSQEVSIAFTEGVDTKTDDKIAAKLSVMENCYIGEKGTPQKRNGFEELSNSLFTSGEQLITNKNKLAMISPTQFAVRNTDSTTGWRQDTSIYSTVNINTSYEQLNIPLDNAFPTGLQMAEGPTDYLYAFNSVTSSDPSVRLYNSGFIRKNKTDGGIVRQPIFDNFSSILYDGGFIVAIGGKVFYIEKSGTNITAIEVTTLANSYAITTLTSSAKTLAHAAVYVENGLLFVIYVNASGKIIVTSFNSSLVQQATYTHTTEVDTITGSFSITWNNTRSLYGVFYEADDTSFGNIKSFYLTSSLALSGGIVKLPHTKSGLAVGYKVTSCYNPITTEIFVAFDTCDGVALCRSTPTVLSESLQFSSLSNISSQAFLINSIPQVVIDKRIAIDEVSTGFGFPEVRRSFLVDYRSFFSAQISNDHATRGLFNLGALVGNQLPIATGSFGFEVATFNLSNFQNSNPKEIHGNSMVFNSGGFSFDGYAYSEIGFTSPPYGQSVAVSAGTGLAAGTYQYAMVYKYIDLNGNVFYSAPDTSSTSLKIVLASPSNVALTIVTAGPSRKTDGVTVEIYRNNLSDVIFKKVGSIPVNLNISTTTVFIDSTADNSQNETLYTTGGILENDPPPVSNIFWTHQERVFCVNEEDPTQIYFSKASGPGEGIHFSAFLYITASESPNGTYQRVTAGASLDDKNIIFKNESCYVSFGEGPNNLGVGSFTSPRLIAPDVGCRDARSILNTSDGVMFMSNKGMYLLTRSLELVYIGDDVEQFNAEEITSAVLLTSINQARFTTRSGVCLAYSYYYKQWSWFTNYESQHAIISNGNFLHLKSTGFVRKENSGFLDISTPIIQRIAIAWLKASGIQNFQRIKRISFVGNYKSPHNVSVKLSYDYENYVWDNVTVTPLSSGYNTIVKPSLNAIYNGANTGTYEYEVQVSRQKCESFKVEISDLNTAGESFSLTGMSLTVGIKKGLNKLSSNKQF